MKIEPFVIRGAVGEEIGASCVTVEEPPRGTALVFPGARYRPEHPLLHYAQLALAGLGFAVIAPDRAYAEIPGFLGAHPDERVTRVRAEADSLLRAALARHVEGTPLVLVGKSLGTVALAHLLGHGTLDVARALWLTPLLDRADVRERCLELGPRSFVAIGERDPLYEPESLAALREGGAQVLILPEADHALEVAGDVRASAAHLARYAGALAGFLEEP